ncbi:MAG: hypothetical protein R3B45_08870 [Bdellovibrionota bacterium]
MTQDTNNRSTRNQTTKVMRASGEGSFEHLSLEDIVHLANKVGMDYVAAKKEHDRLELMKATVRARIMLKHDDDKRSETKIRRLAETDAEYVEFLEKLSHAKAEYERLKMRYESYKNLFDARRSMMSYQKAEMKLL